MLLVVRPLSDLGRRWSSLASQRPTNRGLSRHCSANWHGACTACLWGCPMSDSRQADKLLWQAAGRNGLRWSPTPKGASVRCRDVKLATLERVPAIALGFSLPRSSVLPPDL